ncbi:hypothetical protein SAMN05421796_101784 [Chryseobacterium piscicola]|uniref:Bacteriocin-type signal sequence-containing protein n=1 Tax=Chryseobacterium piscicola TaxID=551459 RepID=A0A1N7KS30_9FLAO|nr:hypothetical protein SAMN05421796_101784 [Chryseobacterium piscicola]
MKNLKKLSREELLSINGGIVGGGCKSCVSCSSGTSCYTDPSGDCGAANKMAKSLCAVA